MTDAAPREVVLVVVSTALQYFNALEAVQEFPRAARHLLLAHPADASRALRDLPGIEQWSSVTKVAAVPPSGGRSPSRVLSMAREMITDLHAVRGLRRLLSRIGRPDLLIIGRRGELTHDFALKRAGAGSYWLVDDGATSVANVGGPDAAVVGWRRKIMRAPYALGRVFPSPEVVFSAYESLGQSAPFEVKRNTYPFMRSLKKNHRPKPGHVWVLGQPLYRYGLYDRDGYQSLLRSLREIYPASGTVHYLPHPIELGVDVDPIVAGAGMRLLRSDAPVESLLLQSDAPPERIATFYSGAFRSISSIFGDEVAFDLFRMDGKRWAGPPNLHQQVQRIYESILPMARSQDRVFVEDSGTWTLRR